MSYQHHVFVSYRRGDRWTAWTRDYFKRELAACLQQELRERPDIFVDEQIHIGADYVATLGESLARSRAAVAIFSGDYFTSQWCLHELDLMLDRLGGAPGRVVAVVVQDCEILPPPVNRIQSADLKAFRITRMNVDGSKYEGFCEAVGRVAPDVARAVRAAPTFDPTWTTTCIDRFMQVHDAEQRGAAIAPTWFVPPPAPSLLTLPRLIT